jgi:hypothetical protein
MYGFHDIVQHADRKAGTVAKQVPCTVITSGSDYVQVTDFSIGTPSETLHATGCPVGTQSIFFDGIYNELLMGGDNYGGMFSKLHRKKHSTSAQHVRGPPSNSLNGSSVSLIHGRSYHFRTVLAQSSGKPTTCQAIAGAFAPLLSSPDELMSKNGKDCSNKNAVMDYQQEQNAHMSMISDGDSALAKAYATIFDADYEYSMGCNEQADIFHILSDSKELFLPQQISSQDKVSSSFAVSSPQSISLLKDLSDEVLKYGKYREHAVDSSDEIYSHSVVNLLQLNKSSNIPSLENYTGNNSTGVSIKASHPTPVDVLTEARLQSLPTVPMNSAELTSTTISSVNLRRRNDDSVVTLNQNDLPTKVSRENEIAELTGVTTPNHFVGAFQKSCWPRSRDQELSTQEGLRHYLAAKYISNATKGVERNELRTQSTTDNFMVRKKIDRIERENYLLEEISSRRSAGAQTKMSRSSQFESRSRGGSGRRPDNIRLSIPILEAVSYGEKPFRRKTNSADARSVGP